MKFLTLKFGERYSADYVNKLYKGIRRNSSDPFDFYCYTENPEGLDENAVSYTHLTLPTTPYV